MKFGQVQLRYDDLSTTDLFEVSKHVQYLQKQFGAVSLVATLPDAGQVTIYTSGGVWKSKSDTTPESK